jgi:uncharacterized protein (TIGR02611 family)
VGTNRDEQSVPHPAASADGPASPSESPAATDDLRHPFRAFFAKNPGLDVSYRVIVGVLGAAIIVTGIILLPLPGPGWLIIFAGLALLATEFAWAERLLHFARDKVMGWTRWVAEQSLLVRAAIGLAGLLLVAGAVWLYVATVGVPDWVPLV